MNEINVNLSTLHVSNCGTPAASAIASRLGLLDQAGRRSGARVVDIRSPELPYETRIRHWDHHLDTLVREGGNIPPIWTRAEGTPTRLVGLTWVDEYQAILVRANSGIGTVRDLVGRKAGVPSHDEPPVDFHAGLALRGFDNALRTEARGVGDVERVDLVVTRGVKGYAVELAALRDGTVDAIFVHGVDGLLAGREAGLAVLVALSDHPDPIIRSNATGPRTISVHSYLLETQPQLVVDYLTALIAAANWADENSDEALTYFPVASGHDLETLRLAYGSGPTRRYRPTLDADVVDVLRHQVRFLETQGLIRPGLDVDGWIDPTPLAAALKQAAA